MTRRDSTKNHGFSALGAHLPLVSDSDLTRFAKLGSPPNLRPSGQFSIQPWSTSRKSDGEGAVETSFQLGCFIS
jgi:hypothetical protein